MVGLKIIVLLWAVTRTKNLLRKRLLYIVLGLFQQVFENLKLNELVKEEPRLDLEDKI